MRAPLGERVEIMKRLFGSTKALIGVVHLLPLPGSPGWGSDIQAVLERATADAAALRDAGFDGAVLENYGDVPYARGFAGRGAVAGLAAVGSAVARAVSLPLGVNVLRNDAVSAVSVAAAIGARFIRVNVHVGAAVTDQGIVQGDAMETMRAIRDQAPGLEVFADVFVKHAAPLGGISIERAARDAYERGLASALIVTGEATGLPTSLDDVSRVKEAVPEAPVLVGSGVTPDTAPGVLAVADGIIAGSSVMVGGRAGGPIDPQRALALARSLRGSGGDERTETA
jgi:membrane complex biogenesis BtpA family protein